MKSIFKIIPILFLLLSCSTKVPPSTIIKTDSGLQYKDLKYGSGRIAKSGDKISINYIVRTNDSVEIENTWKSKRPFIFTIGKSEAIKGIDEGVIGLNRGAVRELFIPGELAFYDDKYSARAYNGTIYVYIEFITFVDK